MPQAAFVFINSVPAREQRHLLGGRFRLSPPSCLIACQSQNRDVEYSCIWKWMLHMSNHGLIMHHVCVIMI